MATEKRQLQIADAIQKKAGTFFSEESPAGSLATVTDVKMSPDLNYADIYISILPANKSEQAMESAEKSLPGLRRRIGDQMNLRYVPKLRLYYDDRAEAKERVEEVLDDVLD
ncbi:MAG: 30S ribosome-binding factor RbfA [Candidatus Paceibacterota bacterium]